MRTTTTLSCLTVLSLLLVQGTAAPAAEVDTPARLRILTAENPPLNFSQDGRITGLVTEVVRELARTTGTSGEIEMTTWP